MSDFLWCPSSCRPPRPGEYEAWLERSAREREELRQGRREAFEARMAQEAAERERRALEPARSGARRFTTDAAIRWGRGQGWRLVDRERWDALTRRHRDLMLAVDALFDDGREGLIGLQGAGRYERAVHRERFERAGGEALARRRGLRVGYLEFVRGHAEPTLEEWWS